LNSNLNKLNTDNNNLEVKLINIINSSEEKEVNLKIEYNKKIDNLKTNLINLTEDNNNLGNKLTTTINNNDDEKLNLKKE